ncbi:GTP cyclohydrolase I FolE [uncultured Fusobacterium sp.]|uniref:GTP cyclohydrolase I FolE n=1 Tax=uncultured Fusobacterium sp. TaxID=159267 RepID=UPI0025E2B0D0|nr:GTP cyclohydrolase I FolE [uncultured Fusobacterium sp.]
MELNKIEKAFETILEGIGEDKNREGLKETPKRVALSYSELFSGINQNPKEPLLRTFSVDKNDLIMEKGIDFYSMCEHHFLPFFGTIDVAYIPNGKIVGFGDIIKTIEILSKRPQIQERLGSELADIIYETLNCQGVMIIIKAKHLCMTMRGAKKENSQIITTAYRGSFEKDNTLRIEVLNLLK